MSAMAAGSDLRFELAAPGRIVFGRGTVKEAARAAGALGRRALVATGLDAARSRPILDALAEQKVQCVPFAVPGEPTTELARAGTKAAREAGCDLVIGFGGGSAIDTGKAIAALLANGGDPLDYLEVVGRGQPLTRASLPMIAVPTTAGPGAEVTRNAVLASPEHRVKASLRSPLMLPRLAVVDPELTYTMPPAVTASTGLDALTQLVEPFVSRRANPLTGALCKEGMARAARSLARAYERGDDADARTDMALASLFGGLALANAGLGAAHGFAGVVGGMFAAPHGAVCAALLPPVMTVNVRALQAREPGHPALQGYAEVARILTEHATAEIEDGIRWVSEMCRALGVPGLGAYGIGAADLAGVVDGAAVSSSMKANPITLTRAELEEILAAAM